MLKKIICVALSLGLLTANASAHSFVYDNEMSDGDYSVCVCENCGQVWCGKTGDTTEVPTLGMTRTLTNFPETVRTVIPNGWAVFNTNGEIVKVKCTPLWAELTMRLEKIMGGD